jgi:DNA phosphorothioation-dependent restriction protein DptH
VVRLAAASRSSRSGSAIRATYVDPGIVLSFSISTPDGSKVIKSLRDGLMLEGLCNGIEMASLPKHLKAMAKMRLDLAAEYIDDSIRIKNLIRPGRLIIVDLRDEFIEKDEALGLFVVQLFADAKYLEQ